MRALKYLGVRAPTPPNYKTRTRKPLPSDYDGVIVGDQWGEAGTENTWILTKKEAGISTWSPFSGNGDFDALTIDPGDITVVHGNVIIHEGALQLGAINYTATLRTLADGTVYGLADGATPGVNEGNIYQINDSGVAQWGDLTSVGGTVTITTSINGINLEAAGGTSANTFTTDDANIAVPTAGGNVFVDGGDNINTTSTVANTFTINLDKAIHQPATNALGTEGLYSLGGNDFMHSYGTDNTFLGKNAGNRTLTTSSETVAIGTDAGLNLTSGDRDTGVGYNALLSLENGDENVAVGDLALSGIVSGGNNSALGSQAGSAHTLADSSNIDIGNIGVLGESNKIRIGTQGAGVGQQNEAYLAGIHGTTVSGNRLVQVDTHGQLGDTTITAGSGIGITNIGGVLTITNPSAGGGNVPIGGMIDYEGALPAGFLWCDGSAIDQGTYPDLYNVIGHKYVRHQYSSPIVTGFAHTYTHGLTYFNSRWILSTRRVIAWSSNNGATWTTGQYGAIQLLFGEGSSQAVSYGGLIVVGFKKSYGDAANGIYSSTDGMNWTQRVSNGSWYISSYIGNDGAGNWVAISQNHSYYSADGINWNAGTGGASGMLLGGTVQYGNGVWSIGNRRSTNGIDWSSTGATAARGIFNSGYFRSITNGKSSDALSWTQKPTPLSPYSFTDEQPSIDKLQNFDYIHDTYAPFFLNNINEKKLAKSYNGFDYEIVSYYDSPYRYGVELAYSTENKCSYFHNGINSMMIAYYPPSGSLETSVATPYGGADLTTKFFTPYKPFKIVRYI